ncbi:hypothetical protein [Thiolapillus sp.]
MLQQFDVYFSGEILEGRDPREVREAVGKLFKLSGDKLDALFSGDTRRIKKNLNVDQSGRFREAFREAGAIVQIVVAGQKPPPPQAPATKKTDSGLQLAPMGSTLDASSRDTESSISPSTPHTSNLEIAPVGPLPTEPAPAAADIDTGSLAAEPAASGSLEEFAPAVEPAPIPDISNLEIAKDDKPIQEDREVTAETIPDVSHLEAEPPKSGSLEKFSQDKEPAPIPDISDLSLDS